MSITGRSKFSIRKSTDKKLVFGTSLTHGAVHQFGSTTLNLPKRPFLGIFREDEKQIKKIMKEWGDGATLGAAR